MKKVLLIVIALIMVFGVTACGAYGYFDTTRRLSYQNVNIGEWNKDVAGDLMEYLNKADTYVEDIRFIKEIASLLWADEAYDANGDVIQGELRDRYKGYTGEQLKDLIDASIAYIKNYLEVDAKGNVYYPANADSVNSVQLNCNTAPLAGGQSILVAGAILTANLEQSQWNSWEPMTYYISMESPNGEDISDYALELLYSPTCDKTDAFNYAFRLSDPIAYNQYGATRSVPRDSIVWHPVTGQSYLTQVYRNNGAGNYISTYYRHTLSVPASREYENANGETVTGIWSRFEGLDMIISAPISSPSGLKQHFTLRDANAPNRQGMILMGKPDGTITELRLSIFSRNINYDPIGVLPLLLNISRGVKLDANGNPVNETKTDVFPVIRVKATRGYGL